MGLLLVAGRAGAAEPEPGGGTPQPFGGPLSFVENHGQWACDAVLVARSGRETVRLEPGAITVQIDGRDAAGARRGALVRFVLEAHQSGAARPAVLPEGERPLPEAWSFLKGNDPSAWRTGVPAYTSALYRGVAPGIDLRVREQDGALEYDVLLAAGADPSALAIRCEGALALELEDDGTLVVCTPVGPIRQAPPFTWEEAADGARRVVSCRYRLLDRERYGFRIDDRDAELPAVIDPGVVWATYLGGDASDYTTGVALLPSGDILLSGFTESPDFPSTPGSYQPSGAGDFDAFVARLSGDGMTLLQATLLGGASIDDAEGLAVAPDGRIAIVGRTSSPDWPVTPKAFDSTLWGERDAFVAVLDSSLGSLSYSTYLGGSLSDWATGVAFGPEGGLLTVSGATESANFPVTAGAFDRTYNFGSRDHFVARINPLAVGAAQLVWSTYLGGTGFESPHLISTPPDGPDGKLHVGFVLAPNGDVVVAGSTWSADFPVTPGAFQTVFGGQTDGYVARLAADGSTLLWSTFLGGSSRDTAYGVGLGPGETVLVGGRSRSSDYPTTASGFQPSWSGTFPGDDDGVVAWLDASGSTLLWSSYLGGGGGRDIIGGLVADSAGRAVVVGTSETTSFPVTQGAYQTALSGSYDGFVARIDPRKSGAASLLYASYLGGGADDSFLPVAIDATLEVVAGGYTSSTDFPATPGAFQTTFGGDGPIYPGDGTAVRLDLLPAGVASYGASSGGCTGPLAMGVTEMPRPGAASFAFTTLGALPSSFAALGLSHGALPAPLPVLGIDLWIHPFQLILTKTGSSDGLGYVEIGTPIPATPVLTGVMVHAQVLAAGCGGAGIAASNALAVTIQP